MPNPDLAGAWELNLYGQPFTSYTDLTRHALSEECRLNAGKHAHASLHANHSSLQALHQAEEAGEGAVPNGEIQATPAPCAVAAQVSAKPCGGAGKEKAGGKHKQGHKAQAGKHPNEILQKRNITRWEYNV